MKHRGVGVHELVNGFQVQKDVRTDKNGTDRRSDNPSVRINWRKN
jgi:hypothetical protein